MFEKEIFVSQKNYSDTIYNQCLSVPCSTNIPDSEIDAVIDVIKKSF
jgi:hypothetical protein